MIRSKDIKQFIDYCDEFYNINTGIYPIATKEDIKKAIAQFMHKTNGKDIHFDSLDRERVRQILQPNYSLIKIIMNLEKIEADIQRLGKAMQYIEGVDNTQYFDKNSLILDISKSINILNKEKRLFILSLNKTLTQ